MRPLVQVLPPAGEVSAQPTEGASRHRPAVPVALNRAGKLNNAAVNRFAVAQDYVSVLASLAYKADVKVEVIEPFLQSDRLYALVTTCKAARLSSSTRWATKFCATRSWLRL